MDEQRRSGGHDCAALSAGMVYDLSSRAKPRWQACGPGRFEFVNTRPVAPSHAEFAAAAQIANPATEALFRDFLLQTGPYDVIHFHGLEGLPARVLSLRRDFPNTRFVLSLHNYYPFCPQVNLWWQERAHCSDYDNGARCRTCLPVAPNPLAVRRAYAVETAFARIGAPAGSWPYDRVLRPAPICRMASAESRAGGANRPCLHLTGPTPRHRTTQSAAQKWSTFWSNIATRFWRCPIVSATLRRVLA